MMTNKARLLSWGAFLVATSALGSACNSGTDDDGMGGEPNTTTGGRSSSSGGRANTGGTAPTGGMGGDEGLGGAGGSGGSGGTGGTPSVPDVIERHATVLIPGISDLRGLTYGSDGSLFASGYKTLDSGDKVTVVLKIDDAGDLDPSFGDNGIAEFNLVPRSEESDGMAGAPGTVVTNDGDEQSMGVVELPNGDLVIQVNLRRTGGVGTRVALLRLDETGAIVPSFGTGGVAPVKFGYDAESSGAWSDTSWGLALDLASDENEEKLVVFGFGTALASTTRTDNDRYVARVLAESGAIDPSFNGDGSAYTYNSGGVLSDGGRRGIVLDDGSILSTGYTNFGENFNNHIILIKLTPAGTPDASFGFGAPGAGIARFNPFVADGGMAEVYQAAIQSNGRIITTGYGNATAPLTSSKLGYLTTVRQDLVSFGVLDDSLDLEWGNNGTLAIQSEDDPAEPGLEELAIERFEERGRDLVVLSDDRIVHAGRYDLRPALMVTRANGGIDETVGDGLSGRFSYDELPPDTSHFFAIAKTEEGDRVAATSNAGVGTGGVLLAILKVGE